MRKIYLFKRKSASMQFIIGPDPIGHYGASESFRWFLSADNALSISVANSKFHRTISNENFSRFLVRKWMKSKRLARLEGTYSIFEYILRWRHLSIDLSLRQTASMWFSNDRNQWKYELSALIQAICIDFPWKIAEIVIFSWEGHFLLSQSTF
jgi:hypothetical protein